MTSPTDPHATGYITRRLMRALTFWGAVGMAFYVAETFLHWS